MGGAKRYPSTPATAKAMGIASLHPSYAAASSSEVRFTVSSIPSAFITAIVVFKVGLPLALNER